MFSFFSLAVHLHAWKATHFLRSKKLSFREAEWNRVRGAGPLHKRMWNAVLASLILDQRLTHFNVGHMWSDPRWNPLFYDRCRCSQASIQHRSISSLAFPSSIDFDAFGKTMDASLMHLIRLSSWIRISDLVAFWDLLMVCSTIDFYSKRCSNLDKKEKTRKYPYPFKIYLNVHPVHRCSMLLIRILINPNKKRRLEKINVIKLRLFDAKTKKMPLTLKKVGGTLFLCTRYRKWYWVYFFTLFYKCFDF